MLAQVVELLLSRGADVTLKDSRDESALIRAAHRGHDRVVNVLLQHSAAIVDAKDSEGDSPLMKAAFKGHTAVVRLLLAANATCDTRDAKEFTPLIAAAQEGGLRPHLRVCSDRPASVLPGEIPRCARLRWG